MLEGALRALAVEAGPVAGYRLRLAAGSAADEERQLALNPFVGKGLQIVFDGRITCLNCGSDTRRSYADGYCYRCFQSLARCDLCVVDPVRCHYDQGTCREPRWGEQFCMQPHLVYLANSSGPKVGITSDGGQLRRWLGQGATQGLVVALAPSRHLAGVLETRLARRVSDRTDWRALVSGDAGTIDLVALRERLRPAPDELPAGVRWLEDEPVTTLAFPVLDYPRRPVRLDLDRHGTVAGRLLGIKGQYLLFPHGVMNLHRHLGYHVSVGGFDPERDEPALTRGAGQSPQSPQMELFP